MFRSLLSYIFVREFLVQDVLYLQEETLLILQESRCYSLLELVDAVPRWMFSVPDLLQEF